MALQLTKVPGSTAGSGQTQPTKYDPNLEAAPQPVYNRPEDIQAGIQEAAPGLVTPRPEQAITQEAPVGAPLEEELVSQDPIATQQEAQQEYAGVAEQKYATPQAPVNFTTPEGRLSPGVTLESLEQTRQEIASPHNRLDELKFDVEDASALISFGDSQANRFADPDSAWAKQLGEASALDDAAKAQVAPALAISGARLINDVISRKFRKQAMIEKGKDTEDIKADPGEEFRDPIDNPDRDVFEAGEPMVHRMIDSVADDIAQMTGSPKDKDTRDQAITYVKDLTDQGIIGWARNKKGKVIPVMGNGGAISYETAKKIAKLYDVQARGTVVSGLSAPTFPATTPDALGEAAKSVFVSKSGKVQSSLPASTFMQLQGSIPLVVNAELHAIQKAMYDSMNQEGENSPFAGTLAEFDAASIKALWQKHKGDAKKVEGIIKDKQSTLKKEMADIETRAQDGRSRFLLLKQSPATLRYQHIANDLNVMNQKGTTRTSFEFRSNAKIQIDPNSGLWTNGSPQVVKRAKEIYADTGAVGVARGQKIHQRLLNLKKTNPAEFQAMNYYYNLGAQFAKHIDPGAARLFADNHLNGRDLSVWTPQDYIRFGATMQGKAATLGNDLRNGNISELAKSNKWLTEKGEWQYPASVLLDAADIHAASQDPGRPPVKLRNMMEADARQSNAGLISILIGDTTSASVLGLIPAIQDGNVDIAAGLREKVWDTIDRDIESTFSGPDDVSIRAGWATLLSALGQDTGGRAAKTYARGLVVAGLYGKTSQKMYTEADDFFTAIQRVAGDPNSQTKAAWKNLKAIYAKKQDGVVRMRNDLTDLYTTSMEKHMSKLNGYQHAMRALGKAMAAINAPSEIQNMFGGIQEISGDNFSSVLKNAIDGQAFGAMEVVTEQVAGLDIPVTTRQVDRAGAAEPLFISEGNVKHYRAGSKERNAWPVDVIQGGDSTVMTLAMLALNSDPSGYKGSPAQAVSIHDAIISGPEGHLMATNAYNNIAVPAWAEQAPTLMTRILDTYNTHLKDVKKKFGEDGANIGTQFIGGVGAQSSFHGLTGYFDTLYDEVYGADSGSNVDKPDMSIIGNQQTDFLEDYQLARSEQKRETTIKGNMKKKALLEAAAQHGWLPPTANNLEARKFRKVSGPDFIALIDIMRAGNSIMDRAESLPKSLQNALRTIPADYRPKRFNWWTVPNNQQSKGEGILTEMTERSTKGRNQVIKGLTGAYNEVLHMVPA